MSAPREQGRGGSERTSGFTLIEILAAMMIFLAGITGVLALMSTALAMHRDGLNAGGITRHMEEIADRVQGELSAGKHYDDVDGRMLDIPLGSLPNGTVYAVRFVLRADGEGVLALISVARHEKNLSRAGPTPYLLTLAPRVEDAVARYRARAKP